MNRICSWTSVASFVSALVWLTVPGAAPAEAQQPMAPIVAAGSEPLEPGDALRLSFSREVEFNGDYPVDSRGMVNLPILGERSVAALPVDRLTDSLVVEYNRQIRNQTVQIDWLRRVRILGQVQVPGIYLVDPTMTVLDAVAMAGGVKPDGKLDGTKVLREGVEVRSDLRPETLVLEGVRSGDQIMVPQKSWFSRNSSFLIGTAVTSAIVIYTTIINN